MMDLWCSSDATVAHVGFFDRIMFIRSSIALAWFVLAPTSLSFSPPVRLLRFDFMDRLVCLAFACKTAACGGSNQSIAWPPCLDRSPFTLSPFRRNFLAAPSAPPRCHPELCLVPCLFGACRLLLVHTIRSTYRVCRSSLLGVHYSFFMCSRMCCVVHPFS